MLIVSARKSPTATGSGGRPAITLLAPSVTDKFTPFTRYSSTNAMIIFVISSFFSLKVAYALVATPTKAPVAMPYGDILSGLTMQPRIIHSAVRMTYTIVAKQLMVSNTFMTFLINFLKQWNSMPWWK